MMERLGPMRLSACLVALSLAAAGCGRGSEATKPAAPPEPVAAAAPETAPVEQESPATAPSSAKQGAAPLRPVVIGAAGGDERAGGDQGPALTPEQRVARVVEAMRPVQLVLIGQWRGITRREIGGARAIEEPEWIWDFQTDAGQPALVVASETSPYFKSGRLTWLVDEEEFQFTAIDREGIERVYRGDFTEPVRDVPGDDDRPQRTYKLELTQVSPDDERRLAGVVIAQQDNNRYLLEVYDRRGERLVLADTVGNQREGTSFAPSDTDYKERTCIISEGLGTMAVSHAGKTYYVCCTGCKAAFEEDPETWIARAEEREKERQ